MLVIAGHTSTLDGRSHGGTRCRKAVCVAFGRALVPEKYQHAGGHGVCQCGAESPHLMSNRERRTWHRLHKDDMLAEVC